MKLTDELLLLSRAPPVYGETLVGRRWDYGITETSQPAAVRITNTLKSIHAFFAVVATLALWTPRP